MINFKIVGGSIQIYVRSSWKKLLLSSPSWPHLTIKMTSECSRAGWVTCSECAQVGASGQVTQYSHQGLVLLGALQIASPQRLVQIHKGCELQPRRQNWYYKGQKRMDRVSISSGFQAQCFHRSLHKWTCRGYMQLRRSDFSHICSDIEWQDTLHKDALTLVFLMEALREEIYKSLACGVDGQQWNWEHATGRG